MKENNNKQSSIRYYIALHIELFIFSFGGVCTKMASGYEFLSFGFIAWYSLLILNLGIYAIVWQQIIKHLPLTTAYANKAITIVWGILWSCLFFHEEITWHMILGAVIVIIGVMLVVNANE